MFENLSREDEERIGGYVAIGIVLLAVVVGGAYFLVGGADWAIIRKHPNEFEKIVWHHLQPIVMDSVHTITWAIVAVLVIFALLKLSQLLFRFKRKKQLQTYEIVLSRDDTTEPFEIAKFFDAVNGMLLPRFQWLGWFTGYPYATWEQGVENGNKYIRLTAPGAILDRLCGRLRAVYQNIRFERLERQNKPLPKDILQLRLERNWFYPLQTLKNYQASISESFFAALDDIEGDCGFQIVMVPLSLRKQTKLRKLHEKFEAKRVKNSAKNPLDPGLGMIAQKELKASVESRGKGLYQTEMRLFADSPEALQSVIGAMTEASAENRLIPQSFFGYIGILTIKELWWTWTQFGMPSMGVGPVVTLSSFHLATLLQLPSMRLRSAGFRRSAIRRVPIPSGLPRDPKIAFMTTEEGQDVGIADDMRYQNLFLVGMQGSGKSEALRQYAAGVLADLDQSAVIVTPDREDARKYLRYIPPEKPVYIIDLSRPGKWGLNILSDDTVPTDQLAGNLLSAFRTAYGESSVMWQSAEFLQQPIYALRKVREISEEWHNAIPVLDFRHVQQMLVQEKFRNSVRSHLPEDSQEYFYWNVQFPLLLESKGEYNRTVRPILNKLTELLASDRVRRILCHPNPITIRKIIDERAVLILYTAKNEVGEETANLFANMLMSLVFQGVNSQAELPEHRRVITNLFLDEVHGYANKALQSLLQESRKYGARTAAATLSLSSLPSEVRDTFIQLFGHKVVFRTNEQAEAETWAKSFALRFTNLFSVKDEIQDRILIGPDDINSLPQFHAAARFVVNGELLPAFIARTRPVDPRGKDEWLNAHPWPQALDIQISDIVWPEAFSDTAETLGNTKPKYSGKAMQTNELTVEEDVYAISFTNQEEVASTAESKDKDISEVEEKFSIWPEIPGLSDEEITRLIQEFELSVEEAWSQVCEVQKLVIKRRGTTKAIRNPKAYLRRYLQQQKGNA